MLQLLENKFSDFFYRSRTGKQLVDNGGCNLSSCPSVRQSIYLYVSECCSNIDSPVVIDKQMSVFLTVYLLCKLHT